MQSQQNVWFKFCSGATEVKVANKWLLSALDNKHGLDDALYLGEKEIVCVH